MVKTLMVKVNSQATTVNPQLLSSILFQLPVTLDKSISQMSNCKECKYLPALLTLYPYRHQYTKTTALLIPLHQCR